MSGHVAEIPRLNEPSDVMRDGLHKYKHELGDAHPMQTIQRTYPEAEERIRVNLATRSFGSHFPLRLKMERALVGLGPNRPGLPRSGVGMDVLLGRDGEFGFEDYLGRGDVSEDEPRSVHEQMEARLGMKMPSKFN